MTLSLVFKYNFETFLWNFKLCDVSYLIVSLLKLEQLGINEQLCLIPAIHLVQGGENEALLGILMVRA